MLAHTYNYLYKCITYKYTHERAHAHWLFYFLTYTSPTLDAYSYMLHIHTYVSGANVKSHTYKHQVSYTQNLSHTQSVIVCDMNCHFQSPLFGFSLHNIARSLHVSSHFLSIVKSSQKY